MWKLTESTCWSIHFENDANAFVELSDTYLNFQNKVYNVVKKFQKYITF